jgi:hypothetical protein
MLEGGLSFECYVAKHAQPATGFLCSEVGCEVLKTRPISEAAKLPNAMQGQTAIELYIQPGKEGSHGKHYGTSTTASPRNAPRLCFAIHRS